MKVVILSTAVSYTGGAIITLLNIMPNLQKQGIEPVFVLKGHGALEKMLRNRNIDCYVIKSYDWCLPESKIKGLKNRSTWAMKSILNALAEIKMGILLMRIKPDLYHLNCIYNGTGVKAAKLLNIPVVWHLREFVDIAGETTKLVYPDNTWRVINKADSIVCVSGYLADYYEEKIVDPQKLHIVYDGINMSHFTPVRKAAINGRDIVIGLSGTATVKNHSDAIVALSILRMRGISNIVLKIAGRWPEDSYNRKYREGLEKQIVLNGLKDNVEFIGMQDNMNEFWGGCDISLICSKREAFGLVATEAMACRVPLICSSTSISRELTDSGRNVYIYETGNPEQLADQLELCIHQLETPLMNQKLANAEKYVRNSFTIQASADALYKIYEEAVNRSVG